MKCYDHYGKIFDLRDNSNVPSKSGGEGTVYQIQGKEELCAKIYHRGKNTEERHQKIKSMLVSPPEVTKGLNEKHIPFAWPNSILYRDQNKTDFIGYTMPYVNLKNEIHIYYGSDSRKKACGGNCTWEQLFMIAYNLSCSVAIVHESNHCIGDLREKNIFVDDNALVTIIDCDSFQIKDKGNNRIFYSKVGDADYIPPELQHSNLSKGNVDRYYSDLFALSVLIFKLLMGAHPYSAKGKGVENAPNNADKIKVGYFPYVSKYKNYVSPPDFAFPYKIIPPSIQDLFERSFVEGHKDLAKRPSASEWVEVLGREISR